MHKSNELACWNTPLANACFVIMTSLIHEGSLSITFRADFEEFVSLICFCFKQPRSYKVDSIGTDALPEKTGFTLKQRGSPRLSCDSSLFNLRVYSRYAAELSGESERNSEFDRFVFVLQEKTIDVLSAEPPEVRVIASQKRFAAQGWLLNS
jgi:hypothetical protein